MCVCVAETLLFYLCYFYEWHFIYAKETRIEKKVALKVRFIQHNKRFNYGMVDVYDLMFDGVSKIYSFVYFWVSFEMEMETLL